MAPPLSCPAGKGDCDNDRDNGCEQALTSDAHCGACGHACTTKQTCRAGRCFGGVVEIATGGSHTCARKADGTLLCWGLGGTGQLGPPIGPARLEPRQVALAGPIAQVVAGRYFTCVRTPDGQVHCFGDGGLLGSERHTPTADPLPVADLNDAVDMSAGPNHTCALRATGQLSCWGGNAGGQLGDGETTEFSLMPIQTVDVEDARSVAAGGAHTCVLRADGTVSCWGLGRYGQLGDGTTDDRLRPTPVAGLANVVQLSAGAFHTCAVTRAGELYCWGRNQLGQLGIGSRDNARSPQKLDLDQVAAVSAGERHTCAVRAGGQLHCFGDNAAGQLGLGDRQPRDTPAPVPGIGKTLAVATGESHSCTLSDAGAVHCFGLDDGQLGDGKPRDRARPVLAIAGEPPKE